MPNNSKWVLDDFSTSSDDEHDNYNETGTVSGSMNQSMNNPWLNGWTLTGHDNVTPIDSNSYNPTGVTNVSVNGVSCSNGVSSSKNACSSNVYSSHGWTWDDIPGTDETNASACCWDNNTFQNRYPHLEEDSIDRPYVTENEGETYIDALSQNRYPHLEEDSIDRPYVIENEGETYIDESSLPLPPPLIQTPSVSLPIPPSSIESSPTTVSLKDEIHTPFFSKCFDVKTKYNDDFEKYYFDMEDIFKNVTLGRTFSDEYYEIVNKHVCKTVFGCNIDSLPPNKKFEKLVYAFNGSVYNKTIVMYSHGHYSMVAYALLDWAIHNPEKIA